MKFKVEVTETLSRIIDVDAKCRGEALDIIKQNYKNEEIILMADDYIGTEINIYEENV